MDIYFVSWIVVFVNPISAMMLAWLVVHHKATLRIGVVARFFTTLMMAGLILQAADHVDLLNNYRPPRSHGWIVTMASINGVIWALFFRHFRGPQSAR